MFRPERATDHVPSPRIDANERDEVSGVYLAPEGETLGGVVMLFDPESRDLSPHLVPRLVSLLSNSSFLNVKLIYLSPSV
jgi:hypothetical protein